MLKPGYKIEKVGQILFIHEWGAWDYPLAHQFVQEYIKTLQTIIDEPWGEVIDMSRMTSAFDDEVFKCVGVLYEAQYVRNNAATAYLMVRTAEEQGDGPPSITTGDAIRATVGIIGTIRGIAALGERSR